MEKELEELSRRWRLIPFGTAHSSSALKYEIVDRYGEEAVELLRLI